MKWLLLSGGNLCMHVRKLELPCAGDRGYWCTALLWWKTHSVWQQCWCCVVLRLLVTQHMQSLSESRREGWIPCKDVGQQLLDPWKCAICPKAVCHNTQGFHTDRLRKENCNSNAAPTDTTTNNSNTNCNCCCVVIKLAKHRRCGCFDLNANWDIHEGEKILTS